MKKILWTMCATLMMGLTLAACGNKSADGQSEAVVEQTESEVTAEEEGGSESARAALKDAKEMYEFFVELKDKDKSGKLSDEQKYEALEKFLKMDDEWDKKYKKLSEADYSPSQWKELQDIKAKIKEDFNVKIK